MGKKLEALIKASRKEGKILPFDHFKPLAGKEELISIDNGYGITYKYNFLARFLPDFIKSLSIENLKRSEHYNLAKTGARLKLLLQLKTRDELYEEMVYAIADKGNAIVFKYFFPTSTKIHTRAIEQQMDFYHKYSLVQSAIINTKSENNINTRLKEQAKRIFISGKYSPDLFIEYFQVYKNFTDSYITTGLELYQAEYVLSMTPDHTTYAKILRILISKPRDMGKSIIAISVHTYREYYKYYLEFKKQKKKDYKLRAINAIRDKGIYIGNINEITKIFTAFFVFVEKSDLRPYDTEKYINYICNKFPID